MITPPRIIVLSKDSQLPGGWHYWACCARLQAVAEGEFRQRFSHQPEFICSQHTMWYFPVNRIGEIGEV